MSYATFEFYVGTYRGDKLDEYDFDKYATRASDYIDYVTLGKAASYNDERGALAKCCCALADQMGEQDEQSAEIMASAGIVASETVGSHSRTFRTAADIKAEYRKAMDEIISMYLLPTGLLYRGVTCIHRIL